MSIPWRVILHPRRAARRLTELEEALAAADARHAEELDDMRKRVETFRRELMEAEDERRRLTNLMSDQQALHAAERKHYEEQGAEIAALQEEFGRVDELIAAYRRRIDRLKERLTDSRRQLAETRSRLTQTICAANDELTPLRPQPSAKPAVTTTPPADVPEDSASDLSDWYTSPADMPL